MKHEHCWKHIKVENTLPVVHHKQLQIRDIVDYKLLELVRQVVPGLLVRTITNIGHQGASLELPPNTGVNTLWPAPAWLQCRQAKTSYLSMNQRNRGKKLDDIEIQC